MKISLSIQQDSVQLADTVKEQALATQGVDTFYYFFWILIVFGSLFWLYKYYELKKYKLKMLTEFALDGGEDDDKLEEIKAFAEIINYKTFKF